MARNNGDEECPYCIKGKNWIQEGRATVNCAKCYGTGQKGAKPQKKCEHCQGAGYNQGGCVECHGSGFARS